MCVPTSLPHPQDQPCIRLSIQLPGKKLINSKAPNVSSVLVTWRDKVTSQPSFFLTFPRCYHVTTKLEAVKMSCYFFKPCEGRTDVGWQLEFCAESPQKAPDVLRWEFCFQTFFCVTGLNSEGWKGQTGWGRCARIHVDTWTFRWGGMR